MLDAELHEILCVLREGLRPETATPSAVAVEFRGLLAHPDAHPMRRMVRFAGMFESSLDANASPYQATTGEPLRPANAPPG